MSIKRELAKLSKDLERPRPRGYEPFDKYAYNVFSHDAVRLRKEAQALVDEANRLQALASEKYRAMSQEEK